VGTLAARLALAGIRPGVSVLGLEPPAPVRRILLTRMADHPTTPTATAFTTILQTCGPWAKGNHVIEPESRQVEEVLDTISTRRCGRRL